MYEEVEESARSLHVLLMSLVSLTALNRLKSATQTAALPVCVAASGGRGGDCKEWWGSRADYQPSQKHQPGVSIHRYSGKLDWSQRWGGTELCLISSEQRDSQIIQRVRERKREPHFNDAVASVFYYRLKSLHWSVCESSLRRTSPVPGGRTTKKAAPIKADDGAGGEITQCKKNLSLIFSFTFFCFFVFKFQRADRERRLILQRFKNCSTEKNPLCVPESSGTHRGCPSYLDTAQKPMTSKSSQRNAL